MNSDANSTVKAFIAGILGAILVLFFVIILKMTVVDDNYMENSSNSTNVSQTSASNDVGKIYDNSVYSVVSVINLQKVEVDNAFLQRYIDAQTNGEPVEQSIGSGFVYKEEDGYYYAVTNNHVVEGSDQLGIVMNDFASQEDLIDAELVGTNPDYDVAVVKFKTSKDITPLTFADSDTIYPGENVYAIGSPYGEDFKGSITSGIVSAPIRTFEADGLALEYIQTDAAINPGNSGGPLLNSEGKVVGMNTLKIAEVEADNMGFSIPSNTVQEIIANIEGGESSVPTPSSTLEDSSNSSEDEDIIGEKKGLFGN